jgi:predicted DNA-binding transcriptional regulator AlpA
MEIPLHTQKKPALHDSPLPDPLLTDEDVARLTGRARKTLQKDRLRGGDESIPFIRLGRLVRYRLSDVERFIARRQTLRSTSESTASRAGPAA